ncbi:hypothetical protein [Streptomyces sp. S.PB5]|uniref:hypothetical protein n=1 Tax=Streptomyces sp. S.PB5 TaxID=3020844 RepID=UPI0025B1136E|nr:hypothetical protein [Streptomyces sp. S.PB5]MDN3024810.1 hypothetical protein [Streptomyces sp. S.PB5]
MHMNRVGKMLATVVAAVGLLGAAGFVVVGSSAGDLLFGYGCGEAEDALGEALAAESVLGVAPEGSRGRGSYQECDDDDRFVVAGRAYGYDGKRESALEHYRRTASERGWGPVADGECFAKRVDGTTAYLTVWGPQDGKLQVEIIADRGDGRWCE